MTKERSPDHRFPISERVPIASSLPEEYSPKEGSKAEIPPSRHVLPKELDAAIKQLNDQELDRLVSAALQERSRRREGKSAAAEGTSEAPGIPNSLPQGKLNAVRAAFKAGVTPARIAREFGISKADVRNALTSYAASKR